MVRRTHGGVQSHRTPVRLDALRLTWLSSVRVTALMNDIMPALWPGAVSLSLEHRAEGRGGVIQREAFQTPAWGRHSRLRTWRSTGAWRRALGLVAVVARDVRCGSVPRHPGAALQVGWGGGAAPLQP